MGSNKYKKPLDQNAYGAARRDWGNVTNQILANEAAGDAFNPWLRMKKYAIEKAQLDLPETTFHDQVGPQDYFNVNPSEAARDAEYQQALIKARAGQPYSFNPWVRMPGE